MQECNHLYALSFVVGADSGVALVSARNNADAIRVMKNVGKYNGNPDLYIVEEVLDLGFTSSIITSLLVESYVNAHGAFDALVNYVKWIKGEPGEQGKQGKQGEKGDTGAAAGFGTPQASVDANIGVPSVEVSVSGPDTAKVFTFTFHNLKGEKGDNVSVEWGGITGDIEDQTDLKETLDDKYEKPATGIPASDLADGVIPDVSGFITNTVNNLTNYYLKSETYTREEVAALIAQIQGMEFVPVQILPTASADTLGKIYLVPAANPQTANQIDEYYTQDNGSGASPRYTWELFGSAALDLTGYVTTTALNTALAAYTTTTDLTTLLSGKQDTINDLAAIRSGAAAGATAVQPGDLPTVPTISTDIDTDKASDTKTASPKAVADYVEDSVVAVSAPVPYDGTIIFTHRNGDTDTVDLNHSHPQYYSKAAESTQPVGGFVPDVVYVLGELSGSVTFALASAVSGNVNHYFWTFETGASAPMVTWPAGITWADGNTPTPGASKHCEVSILGGVGVYMEA